MSDTVTVGILSDTHGYLDERIAEVIRDCDYAIHAGDIMGAHILDELQPRQHVIAVAGNNDHPSIWNSEESDVVSALPKTTEIELPGGTVRIEHGPRLGGFPDHDQLRWDHADVRLVVYGHTHKATNKVNDGILMFNPGAFSGTLLFKRRRSVGLLTVDDGIRGEIVRL